MKLAAFLRTHTARLGMAAGLLSLGCLAAGCGTPYRSVEVVTLTAATPTEVLAVATFFGDVTVKADPTAEGIRAEARKVGRGSTPREAERALAAIHVFLEEDERSPGTLRAVAEHPEYRPGRSYSVEWTITAPPEVFLHVESDFGDLKALGFANGVEMHTRFGDVLARAAGSIQVNTDFGDVHVTVLEGAAGDVVCSSDFGDISVSVPPSRTGHWQASTGFGDVRTSLEGMTTSSLRHHRSSVEGAIGDDSAPRLRATTDFGDIHLTRS
ncbi:MAG: hypothetical protein C4547_11155 [Phycisphaerales bacterium]|nr:MAG: hypothetical protein C4547_11155 [Phycisphaerales bacterium]